MGYVPDETLRWCEDRIAEAGLPTTNKLEESDYLEDGSKAHEAVYLVLCQAIDRHLAVHHNQDPILELFDSRTGGYGWEAGEDVQRQLRTMISLDLENLMEGQDRRYRGWVCRASRSLRRSCIIMTILSLLSFLCCLSSVVQWSPIRFQNPDFCRLHEHCNSLMARPDIIFCPSCGGRNWWHSRTTSLPTEKDEVIVLESSPLGEEEQAEAPPQTVEPLLPPSALPHSTTIATVPIIKPEHGHTIVHPVFQGMAKPHSRQ